ncbi:MAG: tetratricopeptide repeat protein [Planctomycetota bacterium]
MTINPRIAALGGLALALGLVAFTFGWVGPFRAEASFRRGLELAHQKRWREARIQLDRAVALDRASAAPYVERGRVLRSLDRTTEALEDFARARELDPKRQEGWAEAVDLLLALDRPEEALALSQDAITRHPAPDVELVLGHIRARAALGDLRNAVAELDRLIARREDCHEAFYIKGRLHRELGERTLALSAFGAAVALAPRNADYRRSLEDVAWQ